MSNFSKDFKILEFREHVIKKDMWAGIKKLKVIPNLLGLDNGLNIVEITNKHSPALFKCIDEIIVNASDHYKYCENNVSSKRVTIIKVEFDISNGRIVVFNNGPGIPIEKYNHKGIELYKIQLIFSEQSAGTNHQKDADSIKGGINGVGAKIANIHSDEFIVETVCEKYKYIQIFRNNMQDILEPIIEKTTSSDYTKITFIPSYKELFEYKDLKLEDIDNWIRLRVIQTSVYLGSKVNVYYNDDECSINNITDFTKLLIKDPTIEKYSTSVAKSTNGYELNICAIYGRKIKRKEIDISVINGVVSNKGDHISYVKNAIKTYLDSKVRKLTKGADKSNMNSTVRLLIFGTIPGVGWSDQCKTVLSDKTDCLNTYKINPTFLKELSSELVGAVVSTKKEVKVEHDKYIRAKNITNGKLKDKCMLLAAEGDSAITLLRTGLTQKGNKIYDGSFKPSFDWIGIISLQGVVMNAVKESSVHENSDGSSIVVQSEKLRNNKRLNMLVDAFGLNYSYKYETQKELNTLKYGKLILCTDQDLDGTGKICSLVLLWIHTFWPELIRKNKIGKLMTPVIRVYKNTVVTKEFYYEQELDHWLQTENPKQYRIKYYKGLATHDSKEATSMFEKEIFDKNVYMYTMDDVTNELFNVYFGKNPELRKKILITPVKHLTYEESLKLKKIQEIPVGKVQLDIDTKLYKIEAISRQIPHAIDGLNPARRKILMASIIRFNSDAKEVKVFQLGGYVADKMLYHHGGDSLNKTIITMAQNFKNAKLYPYLIGIGQFGDRHGSEAGSPRYISVKLNSIVSSIFPSEDRWLLPYTFDEGFRAEPEYFVPVLPMAVLESYQIVSEGWKHVSFYRTLESVIKVVKDYINNNSLLLKTCDLLHESKNIDCIPDKLMKKYKLTTIENCNIYKNVEYSFGTYSYNSKNNTVKIIDLPLGVFTQAYVESISKIKYIEHIEDYSSTDEIDICIYLLPDSIEDIQENYGDEFIDPITDCFKLKKSLKPILNYYSCDKTVLEFKDNYLADILYWAPVRRNLYKERLIRKEIIYRLLIEKEKQIIRYIELSNKLNLSSLKDDDEAIDILKSHKFPGINSNLLSSPGYTENSKLENLIMNGTDFNYILDLKERELTKKSVTNRINTLKEYEAEYETIKNYFNEDPPGASLWLQEIEQTYKKLNKYTVK